MKIVELIAGEASEKKIQVSKLINNTVKCRIEEMSSDIKEQITAEIKASPLFSFQLDESVDVASCSQLLICVRTM